MKTAINMQSQNEVKDLLNEYVVSPLNTDISTTLSKMENEIEMLKENTYENIKKISPSVNGNISRLQSLLDMSFHFNDEEDAFEKINDEIKDSQASIANKFDDGQQALIESFKQIDTVLTQLKSDFVSASKQINDAAERQKEALLSDVSKDFKQLHQLFTNLETTFKTSAKEMKAGLSEVQVLISDELGSISAQIKESFERSDKTSEENQSLTIAELHEVEKLLTKKIDGVLEQVNAIAQTIYTTFDEQNITFGSYHSETDTAIQALNSQQNESIERKYKTLFMSSLLFGIANSIGIIAMIALYLLK